MIRQKGRIIRNFTNKQIVEGCYADCDPVYCDEH